MLALAVTVGACGSDESRSTASTAADAGAASTTAAVGDRLADLDAAVARWRAAPDLDEARRAAEEARNLITGPGTLGAGDLDGDGTIAGAVEVGLLPAADGTPGLASPLAGCAAVERDLLGGGWEDPAGRWRTLAEAVDGWSPSSNTFPALPSHPQRVVGWSTLALGADTLEEAHEYAGHAALHVAVAADAVTSCG